MMTRQIDTTRFGTIELPEEAIIRFPSGLYGLEGPRAYCLLNHDERGRFQWLQAADAPAIAMVVTDPFHFFPAYEVEISDPAAMLLEAETAAAVSIYTPITISADRQEVYANLLGPVAINHAARLGMQLIQDAGRYTTRHLIGSGVQAGGRSGVQGSSVNDALVLVEPEFLNARTPERLKA